MTAKQITDHNAHGTGSSNDVRSGVPAVQAEDASRQLLAKARYDAFRLMTEARDEAETILDEARAEAEGTKKAATVQSAADVEAAESRAAEIVEAAHQEAASIVAGAHRTAGEQHETEDADSLEAEHKALSDRVSTLRTLADQLENRFAALAATAPADPSPTASDSDRSADSGLDYSPSIPHPTNENDEPSSSAAPAERGSLYSRRSAKLPSLGEDGGRSAFDMSRALRESMDSE